MTEPCDTDALVKTQWVRLFDVFALGPMMILVGLSASSKRPIIGPTVAVFGATTIAYNARNYLRVRRALREANE